MKYKCTNENFILRYTMKAVCPLENIERFLTALFGNRMNIQTT